MKLSKELWQRIELIIETKYGGKIANFARVTGTDASYASFMKWKRANPDDKISIEKIRVLARYAGVDEKWLETGVPPDGTDGLHWVETGLGFPPDNAETARVDVSGYRIPLISLSDAAMIDDDGRIPVGCSFTMMSVDDNGRLFGIKVEGDSMEPEFKPGNILIVNPDLEPQTSDLAIVILREGGDVLFRKVAHRSPDTLILRPLNPAYPDHVFHAPLPVKIIGRVVQCIKDC